MPEVLARLSKWLTPRRRTLALVIGLAGPVVAVLAVVASSHLFISSYRQYVVEPSDRQTDIGIVLGSGITRDGRPYKELQARLDSAADAMRQGTVKRLVLSGDNRFETYDEPSAMKRYLVEKQGIEAEKLQPDYAGRSTYESCERAAKIFEIKQAIIFSAGSHLPRAIYLCRHFGIEAYGIANNVEANNSGRRELMAQVKALYNTHVKGEPTILGESMPLN